MPASSKQFARGGGEYLLELPLKSDEVDLGDIRPKAAGEVKVYAVHPIEFGYPAKELSVLRHCKRCKRQGHLLCATCLMGLACWGS
jgi:hypothetical protein